MAWGHSIFDNTLMVYQAYSHALLFPYVMNETDRTGGKVNLIFLSNI